MLAVLAILGRLGNVARVGAVGLLLAVLAPASAASAHTQLLAAVPAKDAVLASAPTAVTLRFSERLNPDFTTIVVSDSGRQPIPAAAPAVDGGAGTITLGRALGNGGYTVAYRVVSSDGHTVQGSYTFTVADPSLPAATSPVPAEAAIPSAPSGGGTGRIIVILLVGVVVVLAGAVAIHRLRSSRKENNPPVSL